MTKKPITLDELDKAIDRVVDLEGLIMVRFTTEQIINGKRFAAGDYEIKRVGPLTEDDPKF